jgi:hypothetical protein
MRLKSSRRKRLRNEVRLGGSVVCLEKRCHTPPAGTQAGACYGNKTCNVGLTCNNEIRCVKVSVGSLGGPCYGNGTCDKGLACMDKLCAKAPEPPPVRTPPSKSPVRKSPPAAKHRVIRRGEDRHSTSRVQKLRELPALQRLGIQVFDPHPGWTAAKTSERKPVVRLVNPTLGVEFSVSSEVTSGSMSLWRGKIRDKLRASGIDIRRSKLMRIDKIASTLMTGHIRDATGKATHDYSEVVLKTQRRLIRFIWVNRHGDAKANQAFLAALKTTLISQTRGRRR